jgi:ribonuclease HI
MKEQFELTVYTDGGARGNPGPAAYGFVIYDPDGKTLFEEGKTIGNTTNNVAEYSGIAAALKWITENFQDETKSVRVKVFLDSQLATMQLAGLWKIKNENLRNLYFSIKLLERKLGGSVTYSHVRREKNKEADRLVNLALDTQQ